MLDPEKQSQFDQNTTQLCEFYSAMCHGLYRQNLDRGFTPFQAFELSCVWLETFVYTASMRRDEGDSDAPP